MTILHVLSDSNIGGAGILLLNCLRHIDRERFSVKVVLPQESDLAARVRELGFAVLETKHGRDRSFDPAAVGDMYRIFRAERPDIVHTHASLSARVAARAARVPCVFQTVHCAPEPTPKQTRGIRRAAFGFVNRHFSDCILATAEAARDVLIRRGTDPARIHVIVNGSEPLRQPTEAELTALRRALGLAEGQFVFGTAARLETVKEQDVLIRATAEAVRVHPEIRVVLVGTGSREADLRALVAEKELESYVIFAGFAKDIAPYMALFDVNVNTSRSETSCLALSEGMSLGRPMIVSDCPGNLSMIGTPPAGLVFERGDSESLATAMLALAENPALCEAMSLRARQIFEEQLTAERMTRQLEALYEAELQAVRKNKRR